MSELTVGIPAGAALAAERDGRGRRHGQLSLAHRGDPAEHVYRAPGPRAATTAT